MQPIKVLIAVAIFACVATAQSCGVTVGGSYVNLAAIPVAVLPINEYDDDSGQTFPANWTFSLCSLTTAPGCSSPAYVRERMMPFQGCNTYPFDTLMGVVWTGSAIVANYTSSQGQIYLQVQMTCGSTLALQVVPGTQAVFSANTPFVGTVQLTTSAACVGGVPPASMAPATMGPSTSCGVSAGGQYLNLASIPTAILSLTEFDASDNAAFPEFWTINLCTPTTQVYSIGTCTPAAYLRPVMVSNPACNLVAFDTLLSMAWTGSAIVANYTDSSITSFLGMVTISCGSTLALQVVPGSQAVFTPNTQLGGYIATIQLTTSAACIGGSPPSSVAPPPQSSCGVTGNGRYRNLAPIPTAMLNLTEFDSNDGGVFPEVWTINLCTATTQAYSIGSCTPAAYLRPVMVSGPACNLVAFDTPLSMAWTGSAIAANYTSSAAPSFVAMVTVSCGSSLGLQVVPGSQAVFTPTQAGGFTATIQLASSVVC